MTVSEDAIAKWCIENGIDPDDYFEASDEERRAMVRALADLHYRKGNSESFQKRIDEGRLWNGIAPIIATDAENKSAEPKLRKIEEKLPDVNTRKELARTNDDLAKIPSDRLSQQRLERYNHIEGTLKTVEQVMNDAEAEAARLSRRTFITGDDRKEIGVSQLLREARREGISSAGGQAIAESNVRYRSGATPRTFTIREYPINYDAKSQTWTDQPRYRVTGEGVGYVGTFSEKPTARQIREKWRS